MTSMHWYNSISFFFGGAFLANSVPHLGNGISGRPFQTPFASPPGRGLSSAVVNVAWGFFNLVVAYVLLVVVGHFDLDNVAHVVSTGAGMLVLALMMARSFGKLHGGA
ncbi:MAG TPA: hypothetical protein VGG26_12490 [Terracidiphilus sp.]|jgi:hypothetical protein